MASDLERNSSASSLSSSVPLSDQSNAENSFTDTNYDSYNSYSNNPALFEPLVYLDLSCKNDSYLPGNDQTLGKL